MAKSEAFPDNKESVWNFDSAEFEFIFAIKRECSLALHNWDLEASYDYVRTFRREVDALSDEKSMSLDSYSNAAGGNYVEKRMKEAMKETKRLRNVEKLKKEGFDDKQIKKLLKEKEEVEVEQEVENKKSEKERLDEAMAKVEKERAEYEDAEERGELTTDIKSKYYHVLEECYLYICRILKDHKAFFRDEIKYHGL